MMLLFNLIHFDNQHLFLQLKAALFIPVSGGKMGHLPPQICIESHSHVNLCSLFFLKAFLCHTEPFRKELDESHMYFAFR